MRTTLIIDECIANGLKEFARRSDKPLEVVINEMLKAGLAASQERPKAKKYRLRPASLGRVRSGVDLHKALGLADALEDLNTVNPPRD